MPHIDSTRENALRRNLRRLMYLRPCQIAFALVSPILIMFVSRRGCTLSDYFLLESVFCGVSLVLDIPTGLFADRFGRKVSMLTGGGFMCLAVLVYMLVHAFLGMACAEGLLAIGFAFHAGADEALLGDTLRELGDQRLLTAHQRTLETIGAISSIAAMLIAPLLFQIDDRLPIAGAFVLFIAGQLIRWSLCEPVPSERPASSSAGATMKAVGARLGKCRATWTSVFHCGFVLGISAGFGPVMQWYMGPLQRTPMLYSLLFAGTGASWAFGSWASPALANRLSKRASLYLPVALIALALLAAGVTLNLVAGSLVLMSIGCARGFGGVVFPTFLPVDDGNQAALASMRSVVSRLTQQALNAVAAFCASGTVGPHSAMHLICAGVVMAAIVVWAIGKLIGRSSRGDVALAPAC